MGGFGMIMGAALAGAGKGVAEQGAAETKARYEAMLEGVRHGNQMTETTHTGQINAANKAAEQARSYRYDIGKTEAETQGQMRRDAATHAYQSGENAKNRDQTAQLAREGRIFGMIEAAYGRAQADEIQRKRESGEYKSLQQDVHGNFFGVKPDGSIIKIGVVGAASGQSGVGDLRGVNAPALVNNGLQMSPDAPAARPAAAAKPASNAPVEVFFQQDFDRFVNNPANKGKRVTFQGRTGTVQ